MVTVVVICVPSVVAIPLYRTATLSKMNGSFFMANV